MVFRTGNPALRSINFEQDYTGEYENSMTLQGTALKLLLLLGIALIPASIVWSNYYGANFDGRFMISLWGGAIGGFIFAIITILRKQSAHITAPLYALFEGAFLGGISIFFEQSYPGIVIQAVGLTFGVALLMLFIYLTRIIQPSRKLFIGIISAMGAIGLIYLVSIIVRLFGGNIPMIHQTGPIGIIFSLVVVVVAALNLIFDFNFIENGVRSGAPKQLEWYAAFGLMVTLVWLYLELLRLLSKIARR